MLIKPGPLIGAASGSIGSITFTQSKTGLVAGQRRRKPSASTTAQQSRQATFKTIQNFWGTLSAAQKLAWRIAAASHPIPNRLGVVRTLSGYQMYLLISLTRAANGGTVPINSPAALGYTTPFTTISLASASSTSLVLTMTYPQTAGQTRLTIYGARSFAPNVITSFRRWKIIHNGPGNTLTSPLELYTVFSTALGTPASTEYLGIRVTAQFQSGWPAAPRLLGVALG